MVRKKLNPYDTDFSYLQSYYQKGGTYILPIEIVSDLTGQIEELANELKKNNAMENKHGKGNRKNSENNK